MEHVESEYFFQVALLEAQVAHKFTGRQIGVSETSEIWQIQHTT